MGKSKKIDLSKEKDAGINNTKSIVKEQRKTNTKSHGDTARAQQKKQKTKYHASEESPLFKKVIPTSQQNKKPTKIYFSDNDNKADDDDNDNKATNAAVDEEIIKDEDIDKYCDDITDDDNKQYEDWVKLIEAKLYEKKK